LAGALEGVTVVDVSEGIPGGYGTKLLAGLGAEVIKVERPGVGDSLRRVAPFKDDLPNPETSLLHLHLGMGKKSVTLDAATSSGRDLLSRLLEGADIFVESYPPGSQGALGLDYEALASRFPGLIVASISLFGQTGPYASYRGGELTAYAAGGYAYLTGLPEREPIKAGGSQALYQAGLHTASAVLAALCYRDLTGEGDHLDVSIAEAICFTHAGMAAALNQDTIFERRGARLLSDNPRAMYPSTILPCKDGFLHVHYAPADPALMGVLTGTSRLSDPDLWETPRAHADEIDALLGAWLAKHDKREAVRLAQELRHPFTEVLSPADLVEDEQFRARGFFVRLEHPVAGAFEHLGGPLQMSDTPWVNGRAPLLGEHNEEVFCGRLGLSRAELSLLRDRGVV
jgi:crotonobetainyl-CoA:carnitine CoA-transferase CaiB-like acyl-CoA transferase